MSDTCRRCGGMNLEVFLRLSPEDIAAAEEAVVHCAQCAGLSRISIEARAHRLFDVSTEALTEALEWRGFEFHLIGSGPR